MWTNAGIVSCNLYGMEEHSFLFLTYKQSKVFNKEKSVKKGNPIMSQVNPYSINFFSRGITIIARNTMAIKAISSVLYYKYDEQV